MSAASSAHGAREPSRSPGRNLPVAVASGLVLAGLFLGTLFLHPYAFLAFLSILVVVALLELAAAFNARGVRPATPVAVIAGLLMVAGSYDAGSTAQTLGLVVVVLGSVMWVLVDVGARGPGGAAANIGATFLMTLWVPFLASFMGLLLQRPHGQWYVIATVALSACVDIGAFGFGYRFGRRKLAPVVSPAKSWEGLAGGVLVALAAAAGLVAQFPGFSVALALGFGVVVVVASTIGDLGESMAKRDLGRKDLGTLVPGHGGIMDRADAIIFSLPAAHLLLVALGI